MDKRQISKLFGARVALEVVEEKYEGILTLPPSAKEGRGEHVLSKVIARSPEVKAQIEVGDILFWQINEIIRKHCGFMFNKKPIIILLVGDMIAKVKDRVVKLENFQVVGDWCLVRRITVQPSNLIILPPSAIDANEDKYVKWVLEQKGDTVETEMGVGQEVIVDRTRANPIQLGEERFHYIHKNFVIGTVG